MLEKEGNTEYEDMARLMYGMSRYKIESKADQLLTKRLVPYEIMTDTGHLTRYFMDILRQCSEDSKMTMEQLAKDESMLFALVVEGTREEDFDNAEEYLERKSQAEIREYDEMARIVGRCLLIELQKMKEDSQ